MFCGGECKAPSKLGTLRNDFCSRCPRVPEGMPYGAANALKHWPDGGEGWWALTDGYLPEGVPRLHRMTLVWMVKHGWAKRVQRGPRSPGGVLTDLGRAQRERVAG